MLIVDDPWIPGFDCSGDSIYRRYILQLGLKSAKKFIPDDKNLAVIFVHVLRIDGMMDSMVRRGYYNMLQPAHLPNKSGMVPKLSKKLDGSYYGNDLHRDAYDGHRKIRKCEQCKDF